MTMYWCKLRSIHDVFNHGVASYPFLSSTGYGYRYRDALGGAWESSLRRAYSFSETLYKNGDDIPLMLVFEIEERGPRGAVYTHEPYYVSMFTRSVRERFSEDVNGRLLVVGPDGNNFMERRCPITSDWQLPSSLLKNVCRADTRHSYDKLVEASQSAWHQNRASGR